MRDLGGSLTLPITGNLRMYVLVRPPSCSLLFCAQSYSGVLAGAELEARSRPPAVQVPSMVHLPLVHSPEECACALPSWFLETVSYLQL